ncbi:MAG: hypothetical protein F6K17_10850 [Okeania sp. SIO3C4]|nr:hypothetical protein [Okeania sp. SIO3C4]
MRDDFKSFVEWASCPFVEWASCPFVTSGTVLVTKIKIMHDHYNTSPPFFNV